MTVKELKEILNNVQNENMLVCIGYDSYMTSDTYMISQAGNAAVNKLDTSTIKQGSKDVFVIYEEL